ncbi:LysR family transcriptional regulator [Plesiomonas shigelloides subsp. oncorhynchi]|nr:LysR family transcriptional regulator [Plesiomonas shigelloides]
MRLTDLKQLYYFSLVYQEQNLSKAANKAFITQSALSQQLIKLEQHYGIALFERRQSHMLPTEFAEHIYPQVSQLIRDADALEKAFVIITVAISNKFVSAWFNRLNR